jgi:hypothetical protein
MSSLARHVEPALGLLAAFFAFACSDGDEGSRGNGAEAVVWILDNTESIGGQTPTVLGNPELTGGALCFDGKGDALIFPSHPLAGLARFTVEVRFLPTSIGPPEQRFIHMQEAATVNRAMIETRIAPDGTWHLDTYLRSGTAELTLIDPINAHPAGSWHWAALSYENGTQKHFVNAYEELSGAVEFPPLAPGEMSIGTRLTREDWFQGCASELRVHARALAADELMHE